VSAKVIKTSIDGAYILEPKVFKDQRGSFTEFYRREWIPGAREVIQTNRSIKTKESLAGFHYHLHQADYWYVPFGSARVIIYDMRLGSPTEGNKFTIEMTGDNNNGLYIPPGVAHGFCASEDMMLTYLVDNYYNEADELGVAWNDPVINADWGCVNPVISKRDSENPILSNIPEALLPRWPLRM